VQVALKATAGRIEKQIPRGAVVLVDESRMENAHLYLQYWGGVDTMPATQLGFARQTLSAAHPLYLLTKKPSTSATLVERLPYGYLYRVN